MKQLTSYTLFTLAICFFISCAKEYEIFPNIPLVPTEIKEEYQFFSNEGFIWVEKNSVYEYDIKGRFLSATASTYNNNKWGNTRSVSFIYDNQDRLVSREIHVTTDTLETFQTINYLYAGNEVQIWSNKKLAGVVLLDDNMETPIRYTTYHEGIRDTISEPETFRYIYEYQYKYDANGNINEKTSVYIGSEKNTGISKEAYDYDNRNAFYKHVNMPLWYKISEETLFLFNNPVKLYNKDIDEDSKKIWEVFEYQYNKEGYPEQIFKKLAPEVIENGLVTTYTISYISAYH